MQPSPDRRRAAPARSGAPSTVDDLLALYGRCGHRRYGEDVTGLEHALQCADHAVHDGATRELVCAALFHDVGWFVSDDESSAAAGPDADHAALGARLLAPLFGPAVAGPVALHVTAKRWRCTIDPDYYDELSPASRVTFLTQGGPLTFDERERFQAQPGFAAALALRAWDDRAKVPGRAVPGLAHYAAMVHDLAARRTSARAGTPRARAGQGEQADPREGEARARAQ